MDWVCSTRGSDKKCIRYFLSGDVKEKGHLEKPRRGWDRDNKRTFKNWVLRMLILFLFVIVRCSSGRL
jgi:hypothetical protein